MASVIPDNLAEELTNMQRRIVDERRQVLVVFEGRSGRIMGRVINEFMNLLDPRGVSYTHFVPERVNCPREMLRYMAREPSKGQIAIYDRSWYSLAVADPDGIGRESILSAAVSFERFMSNNGVTVVKFFLDVKDKDIESVAKRIGAGRKADGTFLTDDHIDPGKWKGKMVLSMLSSTSTAAAPWDIVEVSDLEHAMSMIVRTFMDRTAQRFEYPLPPEVGIVEEAYPNPRADADLSSEAGNYKSELRELSEEIASLQSMLAASGKSMVVVFEGWDAAGKGGSIKRLTRALNPRGYTVHPVAAPVGDERNHTYLWRFAVNMPKAGHIAVFDRSWYGRMMVEPIEGFCTEQEYSRSASEIRGFERMIADSGGIVLKFWMEVSPEEQLVRFNARAADPSKRWKITDEDWRNREKWDVYERYIDAMISSTNTSYAPWIVVESEDKKFGRLKVLRSVRDALKGAVLER